MMNLTTARYCRSYNIIIRQQCYHSIGIRFASSTSSDVENHQDSSPPKDQDWAANDGIIEGVWVFVRHGDRAPSRPLSPTHKILEEGKFWKSKLPRPDILSVFEEFCQFFPPIIHPSNNGNFLDTTRPPFGFLTHTGIKQTNELGSRLYQRYNRHGYSSQQPPKPKPYLTQSYAHGKQQGRSFLEAWDMKVYSTNYLRTIMSAQSFLDGLFGTQCYNLLGERIGNHIIAEGINDEYDFDQEISIPNHQSALIRKIDNDNNVIIDNDENDTLVPVHVRGPLNDTLNAFDRSPEMMSELVSVVISSTEFQERDSAAAPLAARLANILPGLARRKKNKTGGFNAAPSGINWIEACDHFVCRKAHNLQLSRFSDFDNDDRVEIMLQAMAHQTTTHLAWRFRQWYKNPTLLANIAAPPLREICDQLMAAKDLVGPRDRRPFTIYSCHDITILGLLYGIGADFLAGPNDEKGGWRFWPPYASSLVFELVRIQQHNAEDSHLVRVLLNGKPVKSVITDNHFWRGGTLPAGNGPYDMLYAKDFENVVTLLEKAGGRSNYMKAEDGPDSKSGMASWTG